MRTDSAKLVHPCKTAQERIIFDADMSRQARTVGEYGVIAHVAIVRDMHVCHEEVVAANPRHAMTFFGSTIQRAILPDDIAIADLQTRRFASITEMLWRFADGAELVDLVPAPNGRRAVDNYMRTDPRLVADLYVRTDDRIGTDAHVFSQLDVWIDNRLRVNHPVRSL